MQSGERTPLDIAIFPEIRCIDPKKIAQCGALSNYRVVCALRPAASAPPDAQGRDSSTADPAAARRNRAAPSGGILIAVLNKKLEMQTVAHDPRGVLCIKVRYKHGPYAAILAAYVPPSGSPFKPWAPHIYSTLASLYQRMHKECGPNIIIAGDFNCRLYDFNGRSSLDATRQPARARLTPAQPIRPCDLRSLCQALSIMPLHGRPDTAAPASYTSIQINRKGGQAEVDYILMPTSTSRADFQLLPPIDIAKLSKGHTHMPLRVRVRPAQPPAPAGRPSQKAPQPSAQQPREKLPRPPPYRDERHALLGSLLLPALPTAEALPAMDSATLYSSLTSAYVGAAKAAYRPQCATQAGRDAVHADPIRAPVTHAYRRFKNGPLPAAVVHILEQHRRAHRRVQKLHIQRKKAQGLGPVPPDLEAEIAAQIRARDALEKQRNHHLREIRRAAKLQHLAAMEQMRTVNPHGLFRALQNTLPADPTLVTPQASIPDRNGQPAHEVFAQHYGKQFAPPEHTPPAVTDETMLGFIRSAPPGNLWCAITEAEVAAAMGIPWSSSPGPCAGGGADCALCRQHTAPARGSGTAASSSPCRGRVTTCRGSTASSWSSQGTASWPKRPAAPPAHQHSSWAGWHHARVHPLGALRGQH